MIPSIILLRPPIGFKLIYCDTSVWELTYISTFSYKWSIMLSICSKFLQILAAMSLFIKTHWTVKQIWTTKQRLSAYSYTHIELFVWTQCGDCLRRHLALAAGFQRDDVTAPADEGLHDTVILMQQVMDLLEYRFDMGMGMGMLVQR